MDLSLYGRVLWRFRVVVALGVVLALALTFFAIARVDVASGRIAYRAKEQWAAYSKIFVTQPGFPYGSVQVSRRDPTTLASNAIIYANMADNDTVRKLAFGNTLPKGTVEAATLTTSPTSADALPMISIAGLADTAAQAIYLARAETRGLIAYVRSEQQRSSIAPADRIILQVVKKPDTAKLLKGRSLSVPIVVFLTTMAAVIGLVFMLENLRPRVRAVESDRSENEERMSITKRTA
jgi:hypothetical protein